MGGGEARAGPVVWFRPAAARELAAEVAYYELDRAGRGLRFAAAVERTLASIVEFPGAYPILRSPDLRSAKVERFPYRVVYVFVRGVIDVIAIAHAKRRPGYWTRRRR